MDGSVVFRWRFVPFVIALVIAVGCGASPGDGAGDLADASAAPRSDAGPGTDAAGPVEPPFADAGRPIDASGIDAGTGGGDAGVVDADPGVTTQPFTVITVDPRVHGLFEGEAPIPAGLPVTATVGGVSVATTVGEAGRFAMFLPADSEGVKRVRVVAMMTAFEQTITIGPPRVADPDTYVANMMAQVQGLGDEAAATVPPTMEGVVDSAVLAEDIARSRGMLDDAATELATAMPETRAQVAEFLAAHAADLGLMEPAAGRTPSWWTRWTRGAPVRSLAGLGSLLPDYACNNRAFVECAFDGVRLVRDVARVYLATYSLARLLTTTNAAARIASEVVAGVAVVYAAKKSIDFYKGLATEPLIPDTILGDSVVVFPPMQTESSVNLASRTRSLTRGDVSGTAALDALRGMLDAAYEALNSLLRSIPFVASQAPRLPSVSQVVTELPTLLEDITINSTDFERVVEAAVTETTLRLRYLRDLPETVMSVFVSLRQTHPQFPSTYAQRVVRVELGDDLLARYRAAVPGVWEMSSGDQYTLRADGTGWRSYVGGSGPVNSDDPYNQARWTFVKDGADYVFLMTYLRIGPETTTSVNFSYRPFSLPLTTYYEAAYGTSIMKLP